MTIRHCEYYQSLFKTSHVTRRPSLKRLSGMQVQLLSLWMGKHQILQNCSLSLRLNFIFEINEIGQQLCHKCCFICSNCVIKSLFLRLDQPVYMRSPERWLFQLEPGTSNGSCSDALTLLISDWLFHSADGASCDWAAILSVAFFPIQNYTSDTSWVFYSLWFYYWLSSLVLWH